MNYYIYYNEEVVGPYTNEQMVEMLQSGILNPESPVMLEGESDWKKVSDIKAIGAPAPVAQPAVKSPAPVKKALSPNQFSAFVFATAYATMPQRHRPLPMVPEGYPRSTVEGTHKRDRPSLSTGTKIPQIK
jgi:hypothetical protein